MSTSPVRSQDPNATQLPEPTPLYVTSWGPRRPVDIKRSDKELEGCDLSNKLYEHLAWPSEHLHETAWVADTMCKEGKEDSTYGSAETNSVTDPAPDACFQSKVRTPKDESTDSESLLDTEIEDPDDTDETNETEPAQAQGSPEALQTSLDSEECESGGPSGLNFSLRVSWDDELLFEQPLDLCVSLKAKVAKDCVWKVSAAKLVAKGGSEGSGAQSNPKTGRIFRNNNLGFSKVGLVNQPLLSDINPHWEQSRPNVRLHGICEAVYAPIIM